MKNEVSTLASFVTKLDAEILKEDEAILLIGGFAPTLRAGTKINGVCNVDNCPCPITTNNCNGTDSIKVA